MLASNLGQFQRWYLAARPTFPSIVLHGYSGRPPALAEAVARYLNEYDDTASGGWAAFTPELLQLLALSAEQRSLLGLTDAIEAPVRVMLRRRILSALARRGRAVLDCDESLSACSGLRNVFRVSLGDTPAGHACVHLALQRELFSDRSLPSIIADTYLEWAATSGMAESV